MRLLTALLQTQGVEARREMYQRELAPATSGVKARFASAVSATLLEVEKAQLRGEAADPSLLRQLRVIEAEMVGHVGDEVMQKEE